MLCVGQFSGALLQKVLAEAERGLAHHNLAGAGDGRLDGVLQLHCVVVGRC